MIRESLKLEKVITAITDVLAIFISYILAVYIRYYIMHADPGINLLSMPYLLIAVAYSLIMACVMSYRRGRREKEQGDKTGIGLITINAFGCLGYLAFLYTIGEIYFSRWAMVFFWMFSNVLLVIKEIVLEAVFDKRMLVLTKNKRVLVVGEGELTFSYLRAVGFDSACDFTIIGYVGNSSSFYFENDFESDIKKYGLEVEEEALDNNPDITKKGWLGGYEGFEAIVEKTRPDEVVFALENSEMNRFPELLSIVRTKHIPSSMVTSFNEYIPRNAVVRAIDDTKIIDLSGGSLYTEDTGIEKFGVILSTIFLLIIFMLHKYGIGNAESLRMYETFRYVIFGALGACLFLSMKNLMSEKKQKYIIQAAVSIAVCSISAWIYEYFYTIGYDIAEHFMADLKMVLLFVLVCCMAKVAGEFIGKDNAFLYF